MKTVNLPVFFACVLLSLPAADAKSRNGFDLDDAAVPIDEIRRTGVRRDGVPSIDKPKFVAVGSADFLRDSDRVIGVYRNDLARAYPIRILDHHEVINDVFDGEELSSVIAYWFAWYAFHPDTEVFRHITADN
ncbi:MAG: DUF3179 domain-containing protein [Gammaproteobacteria bacterium]|nr:DUF3179 domain-containing protein [Gammaproteobacteria bacterium]